MAASTEFPSTWRSSLLALRSQKTRLRWRALARHCPYTCQSDVYMCTELQIICLLIQLWHFGLCSALLSRIWIASRIWLVIRHEIGGYFCCISLIVIIFTLRLVDENNFYICESPLVKLMWVFALCLSEGEVLLCSMLSITSTDNPMCPHSSLPPGSYLPLFLRLRHHAFLVENILKSSSHGLHSHRDQPVICNSTANICSAIRADFKMGLTTQLKWIVLGLRCVMLVMTDLA